MKFWGFRDLDVGRARLIVSGMSQLLDGTDLNGGFSRFALFFARS